MESITINKKYPASQEQISNSTKEDDLMKLFDQFIHFDVTHIRLTRIRYCCSHQQSLSTRKRHNIPNHNSHLNSNSITGYRGKYISCFGKVFQITTSKIKNVKSENTLCHVSQWGYLRSNRAVWPHISIREQSFHG